MGQALVQKLKQKHHILPVVRRLQSGVEYAGEDPILCDVRFLKAEHLSGRRPDWIIHLAAQIRNGPHSILRNNLQGVRAICDLARVLSVPIIFLSTANVLFEGALGAYAKSKRMGEELLKSAGVPHIIIRTPLILGKNSGSLRSVKRFHDRFSFLLLLGAQEGKVQPIPVHAVVDWIEAKLTAAPKASEAIHLVGQRVYSYREILEYVMKGESAARFLRVPYGAALTLVGLLERLRIPLSVSTEMIRSMNMDKVIEDGKVDNVVWVDNARETLFG